MPTPRHRICILIAAPFPSRSPRYSDQRGHPTAPGSALPTSCLGPGPIARLLPAFAPGGIGECPDLTGTGVLQLRYPRHAKRTAPVSLAWPGWLPPTSRGHVFAVSALRSRHIVGHRSINSVLPVLPVVVITNTDLRKFWYLSVFFSLGPRFDSRHCYGAGEAGAQATAQSERIRSWSVANRFQAVSQASMMSARLGNTELASQWLRR